MNNLETVATLSKQDTEHFIRVHCTICKECVRKTKKSTHRNTNLYLMNNNGTSTTAHIQNMLLCITLK